MDTNSMKWIIEVRVGHGLIAPTHYTRVMDHDARRLMILRSRIHLLRGDVGLKNIIEDTWSPTIYSSGALPWIVLPRWALLNILLLLTPY